MDSLDVLDELTSEQACLLFKAMRDYNKGVDVNLPGLLKAVFIPFKNQFDRDTEKYAKKVEVRREAGSKGGKQKVANASKIKQSLANVADNDSVNDSVNDNDSNNTNTALRAEAKEREQRAISLFEEFRKAYPGTKRGHETELKTFRKHKDWMDVAEILMDRLTAEIEDRKTRRKLTAWEAQWKHLQTYLNGRFWEAYENANAEKVEVVRKLDLSLNYDRDKEKGKEQIRFMCYTLGYKNCSQRELIWAYDFQRPYGYVHEEHPDEELLIDRGLPGTKANPNTIQEILRNG